jgi:RHS repeat-associated protein
MYGETAILEMHFYYNTNWQVVETRTGTGGGAVSSNPLRQMVWHPYYVDAQVCQFVDQDRDGELDENDDGQYYVVQDANFNVTALIDDSGDVFERYRYSPYGEVTVLDPDFSPDANNSSDVSNPYTYTGRRLDFESGLYYYRNRYYHAQLGRFVSRDPIGYDGGSLDLYEYVGGRALVALDPLGLKSTETSVVCGDKEVDGFEQRFTLYFEDCDDIQILKTKSTVCDTYKRTREMTVKKDSALVRQWFGPLTDEQFGVVKGVFDKVATGMVRGSRYLHRLRIDCESDCCKLPPGTTAYVAQNPIGGVFTEVHLCPLYWEQDANSRTAMYFHELSHAFGGTDDVVYWNVQNGIGGYWVETKPGVLAERVLDVNDKIRNASTYEQFFYNYHFSE